MSDNSACGACKLDEGVTVVTITRQRPQLLRRCMKSVEDQDYHGVLKHLIVIDDCAETTAFLARHAQGSGRLRYVLSERQPGESSGPPRLARLRNYAATLVDTAWMAYLDDDNEYETEHITSLLNCAAASGCPAVHSYRQLLYFEGGAYLEPRWPWCRDPRQAGEYYRGLVQKGVMDVGSNVVRDRADLAPGPSQVLQVDTNGWLIHAEVLRKVKIADDFSYDDWIETRAEDDKLLDALVAARVPIACSGRATVKYYLGGYSNNFTRQYSHSEPWVFRGDGTGQGSSDASE